MPLQAKLSKFGAGLRNRTSINGFGDRCNAIIPDRPGGEGWIRTNGCRDLQSLALDHSATSPCCFGGPNGNRTRDFAVTGR